MKIFNFLSRFTVICNIAFILFVFFRWLEMKKPVKGGADRVVAIPFIKEVIIVLGVSAIVINLLMIAFFLGRLMRNKTAGISMALVLINFLFFIVQVYYFFFV